MRISYVLVFVIIMGCSHNKETLDDYIFQNEDLQIEIVASEPNIVAPVAIDFDKKGRMWVAEMPDYMPDLDGKNEGIPSGRIVIMDDRDGDGHMENATVFLDSVHHLRSIRLFRDGILYADNPNLYYSKIVDDRPVETIIIDSTYAEGGNIEHKPNGLLKSVDNCIYSAKSHYRYCYDEGAWKKEPVFFRGQWGITEDVNGRIYTNDNSNFLYGDRFLPGVLTSNKYIHQVESISSDIVGSREVYPTQATAVNRGYREGTLDSDGKLRHTTSACGPHIFNSDKLGEELARHAFVCVPEANLIKKFNIDQEAFDQKAVFSFDSSEFLVSSDKAFRPVNIAAGPDGNMYIVDFHRGVIQHKIYMTKYLRDKTIKENLDQITNYGRILRVRKNGSDYKSRHFDFDNTDSLIHYLKMPNPWLRRVAQEELIFSSDEKVDDKLYEELIRRKDQNLIRVLWAIAGRGNIDLKKIEDITFNHPWTVANLFKIVSQQADELSETEIIELFLNYRNSNDDVVKNHLAASLHIIYDRERKLHKEIWESMKGIESAALLAAFPSGEYPYNKAAFPEYVQRVDSDNIYYIHEKKEIQSLDEGGLLTYNKYCSSCHGHGGMGVKGQAPALVGSAIVNAKTHLVPLIIMHGLEGEVTINGVKEKYGAVMPAFKESADLTSFDIASISNYIYNAFREEVSNISVEEVDSLNKLYEGREDMWTERELLGTE